MVETLNNKKELLQSDASWTPPWSVLEEKG
jgi:hypothetical protein